MDYHYQCPHCNNAISVPAEQTGQVIECPICSQKIAIPATEAQPGQPLHYTAAGTVRGYVRPHRGTAVLVLGILSLIACAPLGFFAYYMGKRDLDEINAGRMDSSGRDTTYAGKICGLIGMILFGLWLIAFVIMMVAIVTGMYFAIHQKPSFSETDAIIALKSIVKAEDDFKGAKVNDEDDDGVGEYGFFQEMTGFLAPRDADSDQLPYGKYLATAYGYVNDKGEITRGDYLLKIYLPNAYPLTSDADFVTEREHHIPSIDPSAIDITEELWICYAWPVEGKSIHRDDRVFVITNTGTIYYADNKFGMGKTYTGAGNAPAATAAFTIDPATETFVLAGSAKAASSIGSDGNVWKRISKEEDIDY